MSATFVRFIVLGAANNLAFYLIYLGLLELAGVPPLWAMTICFVSAALISFLLNNYLTFRHKGSFRHTAIRYVTVYSLSYGINWGLLHTALRAGVDPRIAQLLIMGFIVVSSFLAQRLWVFPQGDGGKS